MVSRLVLGCGTVGHTVVESVSDWTGSLSVIESDAGRVETLRNENISATNDDPTDPDVLADLDWSVDIVFVAGDDPEANLQSARAASELFPDAPLFVYTGERPSRDVRAAIHDLADRVVDAGTETARRVVEVADSDAGVRTRQLQQVLRGIDGTLGVFMHDNPDPDAIASAIALADIAEWVGVDAETCYFGDISHQENRAFVNLLDLDLRNLSPGDDLSEFDAIALVDHSRPGVNDQLPEDTPVDIVIDHHPPKLPVEARYVDLRSEVGATSTLMAEHLERLGVEPTDAVATALLYGIRVDTNDFLREVSHVDFEAAAFLLSRADMSVLERVETPSISPETLEILSRAIRNRKIEGTVLASCVGALSDRDALAQAADRLLTMDGVTTTLVYGFMDGTIYVSARARGTDLDLGETLRSAFAQIGSAGGHADMAGAQIPLGLLGEVEDEEEASLTEVVTDIITGRFFETIRSTPEQVEDATEEQFSFPLAAKGEDDE